MATKTKLGYYTVILEPDTPFPMEKRQIKVSGCNQVDAMHKAAARISADNPTDKRKWKAVKCTKTRII